MIFLKKISGFYEKKKLESSIIDSLYALIKDSDPLVISNSIAALNEILQEEGGIAISTKMVVYLLNRIKVWVNYNIKIEFKVFF